MHKIFKMEAGDVFKGLKRVATDPSDNENFNAIEYAVGVEIVYSMIMCRAFFLGDV